MGLSKRIKLTQTQKMILGGVSMEIKKAIKKVVALGAGSIMVGATLLSAMAAADLANYPAPFVKDGKFDAFIVVGDKAAAEDVVGAVDIGASLQFEMKKETTVSVGGEGVLITDGVKIKGTGDEILNYNESIGAVRNTPLDSEDLPVMLANGRYVESEGVTDNDETYTQEILLNDTNGYGLHDQPEDLVHDDYLELLDGTPVYRYTLEFDDPVQFETDSSVDGSRADDIEGTTLEIQGNLYTITDVKFNESGTNAVIKDMTLMAGETLLWLVQDNVIEKTVGGVTHQIKVVDVTDAQDSCGVSVDGDVAWIDVKSDKVINGVKIGVLDAKAVHAQLQDVDICELNIGATEIKIKDADGALNTANPSGSLTVDGVEIKGAKTVIGNNGPGTWTGISIEVEPDDDVFLATNQSWTDPALKNFKVLMGGVTTPREVISTKTSGSKKAEIKFTNNDGKEVRIPIVVNSTENGYGLGSDDDEPLLQEGESYNCGTSIEHCDGVLLYAITSGKTAHILEITNVDATDGTVDLKDLTYGRTFTDKNYSAPISLGSLGSITLSFAGTSVTPTSLDATGNNVAETNYGANFTLDPNSVFNSANSGINDIANDTQATLFELVENDIDDNDIQSQKIDVNAIYDTVDDELKIELGNSPVVEPSGGVDTSEDNSDIRWYTTLHGTLIEVDDENKDYIKINYPKQEVEINAFIAPVAAQISTTGGAVKTISLSKLNVGAARLASEVDVTKDNTIIVGGPCANEAAAKVMGLPFNAEGCDAGFEEGKAIIKLYEQPSGKVALVVAGMTAMDTRRATRVLANREAYALSGTEVVVTGTSLTDIKVSKPS